MPAPDHPVVVPVAGLFGQYRNVGGSVVWVNATGEVEFSYPRARSMVDDTIIPEQSITLSIIDGAIGDDLPSVDDPMVEYSSPGTCTVTERINGLAERTYQIVIPYDAVGTVQLADLIPITTPAFSSGAYVLDTQVGALVADNVQAMLPDLLEDALGAYVTDADLSTALASYVTASSLSSTLSSYVTSSSLSSTLSAYVTSASLTTTLSSYATTSALTSGLALKADDSAVVKKTGNESIAGIKTFSNTPVFSAGISVDGAVQASARTLFKASDQTVTSSTTLVNDSDLNFTVAANSRYVVEGVIYVLALSAAGLKQGFSGPAGATFRWVDLYINGGHAISDTMNVSGFGTDPATEINTSPISGMLVTSGTSGNFRYRFAQSTSNATGSTAMAGTWMRLTKVA